MERAKLLRELAERLITAANDIHALADSMQAVSGAVVDGLPEECAEVGETAGTDEHKAQDDSEKVTDAEKTEGTKKTADSKTTDDTKKPDDPKKAEIVKKPEPEITLEKVRGILADKSRAGHTAEIRSIIQKYGAERLSEIDPKHYGEVIKDVEVL